MKERKKKKGRERKKEKGRKRQEKKTRKRKVPFVFLFFCFFVVYRSGQILTTMSLLQLQLQSLSLLQVGTLIGNVLSEKSIT